ncbi:5-aminovalerate aminotransferase DavT [Anaerotignum neopropionicum]|uniref:5-aminovalerate aminotransferase DavT n=1 Tax=Anaerotignum neopropionicum TaxID=36847 RepID=A0A136WFC7_9FIRM|nr:aminotransferase class III-fold pyridoxal phosphate-dependent enzyme [Anaerotignum neopropionicum]KXL53256.1 5-aminovalerate aminotransferase DavT [Anaerotignum neopropionicum]
MSLTTTKSEAWINRDKKVIAPCQHLSYYPLTVQKVEGEIIYDQDNNRFIDFLSSASSLNLGSGFPMITEALINQMKLYVQYTPAYIYNTPNIAYAERLTSVYPGGIQAKVCFGNCGSDANDAAIKFARAFTGRSKIITFINGYHGNTYGSMSLSAVTTRMRSKMGPFLPDIFSFPFYGDDLDNEVCQGECTREIERAFETYLPAEEVAAVIIEPVQGDAGLIPAHGIFMNKLHALCKKNGILFISEEVQQAFFRTGKWFAIEHYDIVPDGIILGKSVGGSLPLGAFMARGEIMDSLPAPAHLFTLGGHALACATGCAAFDYMQGADFQDILAKNENAMEDYLNEIMKKFPEFVTQKRGKGMSRGLVLTKQDQRTGEIVPDEIGTYKVLYRAYEKGLVMISLGKNVLRIQPPLNIKPENLKRGFEIIDEAIEEYLDEKISDEVLKYREGW